MVRLRWQLAHLISQPSISCSRERDRVFVERHGDDAPAFGQRRDRSPTPPGRSLPQSMHRARCSRPWTISMLRRRNGRSIASSRPGSSRQVSARCAVRATVAVDADQLTAADFGLHAGQSVALVHEHGHVRRLSFQVVELEGPTGSARPQSAQVPETGRTSSSSGSLQAFGDDPRAALVLPIDEDRHARACIPRGTPCTRVVVLGVTPESSRAEASGSERPHRTRPRARP